MIVENPFSFIGKSPEDPVSQEERGRDFFAGSRAQNPKASGLGFGDLGCKAWGSRGLA